jgi:uncharacterized protein
MPWDFWLILVFLGVVIPWRGRVRLKRLLDKPSVDTKEKITLYASTIVFQWVAVGIVMWRAFARGLTPAQLALNSLPHTDLLVLSIGGALLLGGAHWWRLRRVGAMNIPSVEAVRKIASRILPATTVEFFPYLALAITAGVCEEVLYRGFAMAALYRAGLAIWFVVLLTAILFGLAHAYQGWGGMFGTMVLGLIFGLVRFTYDSLAPLMVWHAVVDIVAGIAAPRYLLQGSEQK